MIKRTFTQLKIGPNLAQKNWRCHTNARRRANFFSQWGDLTHLKLDMQQSCSGWDPPSTALSTTNFGAQRLFFDPTNHVIEHLVDSMVQIQTYFFNIKFINTLNLMTVIEYDQI